VDNESNMNGNPNSQERGRWDFVHFGIIFGGFLIGLVGIATLRGGVAIMGAVLIAYGLAYFAFQQWLRNDSD
jgi:hypothetical protein